MKLFKQSFERFGTGEAWSQVTNLVIGGLASNSEAINA